MKVSVVAGALCAALAIVPSAAAAAPCEIHVYPAAGPTSVGDDFDAIKRVNQDLKVYDANAGRPLNWLTVERQLALLKAMPLDNLTDNPGGTVVLHDAPVARLAASAERPSPAPASCAVELLLPQIILERGALSTRSLRVFGVVRRYSGTTQTARFGGFAAAPMTGFQLRVPADAPAATAIVEDAYRAAVTQLLQNAGRAGAAHH